MSKETKEQFSTLSAEAISQIKTFPSLFASENHQYGRTDDAHVADFGLVTDVKIQDNSDASGSIALLAKNRAMWAERVVSLKKNFRL